MRERENYSDWPLTPQDLEDRDRLRAEFLRQVAEPEGNDERLAACYEACVEGMDQGWLLPVVEDMIHWLGLINRRRGESDYANMVNKTFQSEFINKKRNWTWQKKYKYPDDFTDPQIWSEAMQEALADRFLEDVIRGELIASGAHSNITWRYIAVALYIFLHQEELGDDPTLLDVGASLNLGLKKLMMAASEDRAHMERFPFPHVEVVGRFDHEILEEETVALNALLARRLPLAGGTGVEAFPFRREVAISQCFRPSEWINDRQRVQELYALIDTDISGVYYHIGDFSEVGMEKSNRKFTDDSPLTEFNLVSFLTVWNQLPPEKQAEMLEYSQEYLKPGGKALVVDFAYKYKKSPTGLRTARRWVPGSYRGYEIDPRAKHPRPKELFRAEDSRFRKVRLAPGIGERIIDLANS